MIILPPFPDGAWIMEFSVPSFQLRYTDMFLLAQVSSVQYILRPTRRYCLTVSM